MSTSCARSASTPKLFAGVMSGNKHRASCKCGWCNKTRLSQVRLLADVEAAWFGAMLDGEGCVHIAKRGVTLDIGNTEVELIATALRVAGTGSILKRRGTNKPFWVWWLGRQNDVADLLHQLAPYSIKAQEVLA